jgi:hypothetical protein
VEDSNSDIFYFDEESKFVYHWYVSTDSYKCCIYRSLSTIIVFMYVHVFVLI